MTARSTDPTCRRALFAGSFDPFTIGHASVVERALGLFDEVVVAVGVNASKAGATGHTDTIASLYRDEPRVKVIGYRDILTVDLARREGCGWLLRGARSVKDFEYERDMADINRRLSGIETVVLFTLPEHAAISSSVVRELASYGRDISSFLPQPTKPSK